MQQNCHLGHFYKLNLTNIKTIKKFGKVPIGKPFKGVNYSFNNSNELIIEAMLLLRLSK